MQATQETALTVGDHQSTVNAKNQTRWEAEVEAEAENEAFHQELPAEDATQVLLPNLSISQCTQDEGRCS